MKLFLRIAFAHFLVCLTIGAFAQVTSSSHWRWMGGDNSLGVRIWQADLGVVSGAVSKDLHLENKLPSGVYMLMIQEIMFITPQKL